MNINLRKLEHNKLVKVGHGKVAAYIINRIWDEVNTGNYGIRDLKRVPQTFCFARWFKPMDAPGYEGSDRIWTYIDMTIMTEFFPNHVVGSIEPRYLAEVWSSSESDEEYASDTSFFGWKYDPSLWIIPTEDSLIFINEKVGSYLKLTYDGHRRGLLRKYLKRKLPIIRERLGRLKALENFEKVLAEMRALPGHVDYRRARKNFLKRRFTGDSDDEETIPPLKRQNAFLKLY